MAVLADRFGRTFPYLRLSVIEACNFSCSYCLPNGYQARPGLAPPLGIDEIARLARAFAAVGTRKVRLTGGEPSLRKDLTEIIRITASTPGVDQVALTTNGCLLRKRVAEWQDAGLTALNVSVDALDRQRFMRITGHDRLDAILLGIDAALAAGLPTVRARRGRPSSRTWRRRRQASPRQTWMRPSTESHRPTGCTMNWLV